MWRLFLLPLLLCPALPADDPEPPGSMTKELKALQGTWKLSSIRAPGLAGIPQLDKVALSLTFAKNKLTVKQDQNAKEGTFKLDPKKKPMHIDLSQKGEKTAPGIYKIEKGQLHLAFRVNPDGKERPKSFDDKEVIVMIFAKQKP